MAPPVIYLAGPEVFLPDAVELGERKKEICRRHGFDAAYPMDEPPATPPEAKELFALEVFDICVRMMRSCDLVVANFTPFRGVSMDVGTAVEVGFMFAAGKPVFGYTNVAEAYADRVGRAFPDLSEAELVEDFDLVDNLMCEGVVRRSHGIVIRHSTSVEGEFRDLAGFEECVRRAGLDFPDRNG
jgi:nucleoside 2-deoxyribosyltransferase